MRRRLARRRRKHLANVANVIAVLQAAGINAIASNAASGPPRIATEYGTLSFEDDGTIRGRIWTERPVLRAVP